MRTKANVQDEHERLLRDGSETRPTREPHPALLEGFGTGHSRSWWTIGATPVDYTTRIVENMEVLEDRRQLGADKCAQIGIHVQRRDKLTAQG